MFFSKYGTLMGDVPGFLGRIFYVNPSATYQVAGDVIEASDNNNGLTPTTALRTVQAAINLATSGVGDIIAMLQGTHSSASQVTITKGLTFVAINPAFRDRENSRPNPLAGQVVWTSTFAGTAVALTVGNCSFIGIRMVPVTAQTFMTGTTCARTVMADCAVELSAAASTSTKGIVFSGGSSTFCHFVNCVGLNSVATSAQGPAFDVSGLGQMIFENGTILLTGTSSAWAVAIQCASGTSGVFRNNTITALGAGTITIGIDGTGVIIANSVLLQDNKVGVSPGAGAFKNFDADSACLVTSYLGTVHGGSGGTLSTVAI